MLDALEVQKQRLISAKTEQLIISKRFRGLVESTSAIPWELDLKTWCFIYVGHQAEALLGYPREDWYQENFWPEHLHSDDRDESIAFCQSATADLRNHQFEYRMRCADGNYVWIHDDVQVICENGQPICLQGFMFDITARKHHEQAITNISAGISSESGDVFYNHLVEHFAKLFNVDYAFIGIINKNDNLQIDATTVYAHGKIVGSFSYSLIDTPCQNVVGKETCAYPSNVQKTFPNDQMLVDMEIEGYIGTPLFKSNGEPLGLLVVLDSKPIQSISQITELFEIFASRTSAEIERMQAEESVRKLSQAVEQSPNTVMITDPDGIIEYVNSAFTLTTEYTAEDVIGMNPRILQSGITQHHVYQDLWATIKQGNVWRGELINKHKDGSLYTEEETIAPLLNSNGKITHYVSIKIDITKRRETEEALRRSQKNGSHRSIIWRHRSRF